MATINGVPVNFGLTGTLSSGSQGISITGITGTLIQSVEQTANADCEKVKDGNGNEIVHGWANQNTTATLEWIIGADSLANAIVGTTFVKKPGNFVAVTACTSQPALIGVSWEVQSGVKISQSNTGFAKISMPLWSGVGITGAAS